MSFHHEILIDLNLLHDWKLKIVLLSFSNKSNKNRGVTEMENRKNIVVLFGGASSEYEVSLQSAYAVICSMGRVGQRYYYRLPP